MQLHGGRRGTGHRAKLDASREERLAIELKSQKQKGIVQLDLVKGYRMEDKGCGWQVNICDVRLSESFGIAARIMTLAINAKTSSGELKLQAPI